MSCTWSDVHQSCCTETNYVPVMLDMASCQSSLNCFRWRNMKKSVLSSLDCLDTGHTFERDQRQRSSFVLFPWLDRPQPLPHEMLMTVMSTGRLFTLAVVIFLLEREREETYHSVVLWPVCHHVAIKSRHRAPGGWQLHCCHCDLVTHTRSHWHLFPCCYIHRRVYK